MKSPHIVLALVAAVTLLLSGCTGQETSEPAQQSPNTQSSPTLNAVGNSAAATDDCGDASCVSLTFTGDFLVHNLLWAQAGADARLTGQEPLDFEPMIASQKPYLETSDLAVCQMETPVAVASGPYSGYPSFNVPPQILTAAANIGWDACMTASNHSIDHGTAGLERTYKAVEAAGMGVTGTNLSEDESQQPDIFESANGVKIAVVTGTYGLNGQVPEHNWQVDMLDTKTMIAKAQRAREKGADIVVANMHAGDEYVTEPNNQQVTVARELSDSEAFDLIVGQHAHTVQPIEKFGDTWVVYGMGNNVTELSPSIVGNNEGIMVNAIMTRDDAGDWSVKTMRWAPSMMVDDPSYRYCITSPSAAASSCAAPALAAASYARVKQAVESRGGVADGLQEWVLN